MFSCLSANSYPLLADVYESVDVQNSDTGLVLKQWQFKETISCSAKGQISTGIDKNASNVNSGQKTIKATESLKIRSKNALSTADRVVLIRNDFGTVWKEDIVINSEGGFQNSTIFEPKGSVPILDHNGSVSYTHLTLPTKRIV